MSLVCGRRWRKSSIRPVTNSSVPPTSRPSRRASCRANKRMATRAGDIDGNAAQQRRRLAMPAILARDGDHAMCATPARNKRGQRGGDAESDSKAERKLEQVA